MSSTADTAWSHSEPCPECGARRGLSIYSSGWGHCFACGANVRVAEGEDRVVTKAAKGWTPIHIETYGVPKRGLNEETCKKWGYGYGTDEKGETVQIANFYNEAGVPVAQKLRYKDKSFKIRGQWDQAGLYGRHLWRDAGKMVVITEGELDALSVSQVQQNKWPVVSIPNGVTSAKKVLAKELDWLERFESVVLMFDMDEPGQKAAAECAELFTPQKAKLAKLPLKDANDLLKANRGKEIVDAIWAARPFRPDGIVSGVEVWEAITKDDTAESADFPHTGLNAMTRGMRPREVITITAGTGIGKSTFCREIAYDLAVRQGKKVGYIGLEESVKRSAIGLCSIGMDKPLHLDMAGVDYAALEATFKTFEDRVFFYDHFGSIEAGNLLAKMRFMAKGCGVSHIILDHLTIAISGMEGDDERRSIDRLMTNLSSLAQEAEVCIILVSHLRRTEGKPHEEGKAVTLADLRGSHGIAQNSRTIISLERDQQGEGEERNRSLVRVLKCTHTGITGRAGVLRYDPATGRLTEDFGVEAFTGKEEF